MEFDLHLLLDILEFLRTLKNVPLPAIFETSRDNLLGRVQIALSPGDNYIDMKPGKQLTKPSPVVSQSAIEGNVSPSGPTASSFLYNYHTKIQSESPQKVSTSKTSHSWLHENVVSTVPESSVFEASVAVDVPVDVPSKDVVVSKKTKEEEEMEESLLEVYLTMSFVQVKDKSHKYGELQRREKRIIFDNIRTFWGVVIGSHFLSYDAKSDTKPSQILPLKGSTCRPADQIPRSVKKFANSTFDICLEDCRVFQFIAPTTKEMDDWMTVIERTLHKPATKKPVSNKPSGASRSISSVGGRKDSSKEYDTTIPDIVGALSVSSNGSKSQCETKIAAAGQPLLPGVTLVPEMQKLTPATQTLPSISPTVAPKRIFRDLPPPPVASDPDDEANGFYNEIENPQRKREATKPKYPSVIPYEEEEQEEEEAEMEQDNGNYDDVANVRQQMVSLGLTNNRGAVKKTIVHSSEDDEQETYDDVDDVKNKVQILREAEAIAKAEACEREKRILKVPPKLPMRVVTVEEKPIQISVTDEQETYDDVQEVKNEVQILREAEAMAKAKTEAYERNKRTPKVPPKVPIRGASLEEKPAQINVDCEQEAYDDIEAVKTEVQTLREAEAMAKAKTEACEKEKRTLKVPPKLPTRVSPIKCLIDKIRNRNESPQKETEMRKQVEGVTPPLQQQHDLSAEIRGDQNSKESNNSYPNNQSPDNSNYNTPRTPRPVHTGNKPLGESMREEEEEEIYDDVLDGTSSGNYTIGRDNELEKRKRNDVLLTKYTTLPDGANSGSLRGAKKAVKNLTKSFEGEIYENQPGDQSAHGNSEFHRTQKFTNSNLHPSAITRDVGGNDDDDNELYDDVQIVAQKNRAKDEPRKNLALETPPKNTRVLAAAKNLFSEKNTTKKIQKIVTHDNNIEDDNDIYDDCTLK